jgi:hypothetical protein
MAVIMHLGPKAYKSFMDELEKITKRMYPKKKKKDKRFPDYKASYPVIKNNRF